MEESITIDLTPTNLELINRRITGIGGWQSLCRKLQKKIVNGQLTLTPVLIEKIRRYDTKYGTGGWEDRLKPIFKELRERKIID